MNRRLLLRDAEKLVLCLLLALMVVWPLPASSVEAASTISRRASTTANNRTGSTSLTIPRPTGTLAKDVLVAQLVARSATVSIAAPSGWHLIRTVRAAAGLTQASYYRVATASEPASYTWTFAALVTATGGMTGFIGVNSTSPIDVTSGRINGATSTASFTQVTTTLSGDMLLTLVAVQGNTTITPTTGFSEDYDRHDAWAGNGNTAEMSQAIKSAAGLSHAGSAREDTLSVLNVTQLIAVKPASQTATSITIAVAGDMECTDPACWGVGATNLVANMHPSAFFPVGDLIFNGSYASFVNYYDPSWGAFRSISHPAIGNHDGAGSAYYSYWGSQAGPAGAGWYSFNKGGWHFVILNSNCVAATMWVSCQPGSPQINWLNSDLTASTALCTIAFLHHPYYTSGATQFPELKTIFSTLYQHGVELYLAGHTHYYQRFYPQDANSNRATLGLTEIVVGTGGGTLANVTSTISAKNQARQIAKEYGVLKLTLNASSYSYKFIPTAGSATDSGSGNCH